MVAEEQLTLPVPWRLPVPLHRVGLLFSIPATDGWAVSVVISLSDAHGPGLSLVGESSRGSSSPGRYG